MDLDDPVQVAHLLPWQRTHQRDQLKNPQIDLKARSNPQILHRIHPHP